MTPRYLEKSPMFAAQYPMRYFRLLRKIGHGLAKFCDTTRLLWTLPTATSLPGTHLSERTILCILSSVMVKWFSWINTAKSYLASRQFPTNWKLSTGAGYCNRTMKSTKSLSPAYQRDKSKKKPPNILEQCSNVTALSSLPFRRQCKLAGGFITLQFTALNTARPSSG